MGLAGRLPPGSACRRLCRSGLSHTARRQCRGRHLRLDSLRRGRIRKQAQCRRRCRQLTAVHWNVPLQRSPSSNSAHSASSSQGANRGLTADSWHAESAKHTQTNARSRSVRRSPEFDMRTNEPPASTVSCGNAPWDSPRTMPSATTRRQPMARGLRLKQASAVRRSRWRDRSSLCDQHRSKP